MQTTTHTSEYADLNTPFFETDENALSRQQILSDLKNRIETIWLNPNLSSVEIHGKISGYSYAYMLAAQNRFMRFLPYIAIAFPETAARKGIIESNLLSIPHMQESLIKEGYTIPGQLFLKDDAHLPIAGSVKARGGIHEVLKITETLLQKAEMLSPTDDYSIIATEPFRRFLSNYTIQVGSTGNLGISIGRMSARLGYRAVVHMSADAKQWKKDLLRSEGVIVKEYDGDYSKAVAQGRQESENDPASFFIDDENSMDLFFGYSSAAMRLSVQLRKKQIPVDENHPLFVYIPCGVGGAPAGITFGLKEVFGDAVHCFFSEPVEAPCFLLGMASGKHGAISVQDIGLTGQTIADGLAVGRASSFCCEMMEPILSGALSIKDEKLVPYQKQLYNTEKLIIEPSACAGFRALEELHPKGSIGKDYITARGLDTVMEHATHVVWATGGGLMPEEEYAYLL